MRYFPGATLKHQMCSMSLLNGVTLDCIVEITIIQTPQDLAMLRSQLLTQIQPIPVNSARRCNFNQSPQLSRKYDQSSLSPTTPSLLPYFSIMFESCSRNVWVQCLTFAHQNNNKRLRKAVPWHSSLKRRETILHWMQHCGEIVDW